MDAQSSASASVPRNLGELPLITCTDCGRAKVVKRRSKQEHSFDKIFYCCPYHKRNGGCPFFYWDDEYLGWLLQLKKEGKLATEDDIFGGVADVQVGMVEKPKMKDVHEGRVEQPKSKDEPEMVQLLRLVSGLGNEVVRLLKAILFVSVCILILQLLSLVPHKSM